MIHLSDIKGPVVLAQTERFGYRDPAAFYHEGVFYLYFTIVEQLKNIQYFTIGMSQSRDLVHWSTPVSLTGKDKTKEYSSPGNIISYGGDYYLCMQTYCRENGEIWGNEKSRIFTMKTKDFIHFEEPVLLKVRGDDVLEEDMGRMIDPYLLPDKDEPEKIWCFYKQNGVSYSYTYDMEHWTYAGCAECGENVCVLVENDSYLVIHSPENGIGMLRSKDLKTFEPVCADLFLSQSRWEWAKDRISAAFVLDLRENPEIGCYLMFYHGDNEKNGTFLFGASIGMAVSKDLKNFITFDSEIPTYPNLGNQYPGDYYEALPFEEYINNKQQLPDKKSHPIFDIRDFGACPVKERLNTAAFQAAADACERCGGGTILVQGGAYVTGTFYLKDNTTLHIAGDSAVVATRENGRIFQALIAANGADSILITGGGKICGSGEWYVYEPKLKPRLSPFPISRLSARGTENRLLPDNTFRYQYRRRIRFSEDKYGEGVGPTSRPAYMVLLKECSNVTIENIILEDSMSWTLNLFCCRNVLVKDMVINNNRHVANTDGIDITGSSRVEISHCFVSTADDGIVIKNPKETNREMSDIYIHDCQVITVMNSLKIGTETRHDITHVVAENCHFFMPDIYPGTASGISIESADGSHIRDITVRNITMDRVTCPLFLCLNMRNRYHDPECCFGGSIDNVLIEHIKAEEAQVPSLIFGSKITDSNGEEMINPVKNITVRSFCVNYKEEGEIISMPDIIEEYLYEYPENNSFGDVDAYGIWVRHGENISLEDIRVTPRSCNTREMIKIYP